ncbi:MAG TPA: hypothetical protein VEY69_16685, partial [Lautropia sp.]|nr:hypothetical protein [Lautropia sp.]
GAGADTATAFGKALELAECLADKDYQLRAIWGLWSVSYLNGRYQPSLALSARFAEAAAAGLHSADRIVGDRMTGMSLFCLGRLGEARRYLQRVVDEYVAPVHRSHLIRFIYEQKMIARSSLAHVLWLQGFADQAASMAAQAIEDARAIDHPPSVCYALTESVCAIAVLFGGTSALQDPAEQAVQATRRHGISTWKARGRMWRGLQLLGAGDTRAYERDLLPAFNEIGDALFVMHYTGFVSAACEQLGSHGLVAEGMELVQRALDRAERAGDKCSTAELLRVRGEVSARAGISDLQVEAQLEEAMAASEEQESLAWRLRCATSLAKARQRRGAFQQAQELLAPVYAEFAEGFESADLRHARLVLAATGQH